MDEFLEIIKQAMELGIRERQLEIERAKIEDEKELVAKKILKGDGMNQEFSQGRSKEKKYFIEDKTITILYSMSMDGRKCFRLSVMDKEGKRLAFTWFY